uniref:Non-specific serine/threonine protein kinase n=1 Tax=Macrostomum lignano TaxID=282301 RepID=A0A1I8F3Q6_9PLAT
CNVIDATGSDVIGQNDSDVINSRSDVIGQSDDDVINSRSDVIGQNNSDVINANRKRPGGGHRERRRQIKKRQRQFRRQAAAVAAKASTDGKGGVDEEDEENAESALAREAAAAAADAAWRQREAEAAAAIAERRAQLEAQQRRQRDLAETNRARYREWRANLARKQTDERRRHEAALKAAEDAPASPIVARQRRRQLRDVDSNVERDLLGGSADPKAPLCANFFNALAPVDSAPDARAPTSDGDYEEFFVDIADELSRHGRIRRLATCGNALPHLRGSVYCRPSEAAKALAACHGRWYAGRRLICRLADLGDWRDAVCGRHQRVPVSERRRRLLLPASAIKQASTVRPAAQFHEAVFSQCTEAQCQNWQLCIARDNRHGHLCKVKLGVHTMTGHQVAVKIVNRARVKSLDVASKLRREIQNMQMFRHPHIIKLYQHAALDIFMIMEYVSGGELFEHIVKSHHLTEKDARRFFQQIISGVDYCHRHMIVHRDLKPENLLLDSERNVKIADFGLSNIMADGELLRTSCGSPNYAAPEVISGKLYVGPEVDIWSAGVILYALLCGSLPFDDEHVPTLFSKIRSGQFLVPPMCLLGPPSCSVLTSGAHPWFAADLPGYLFPPDMGNDWGCIDKSTVDEVVAKCGVSERELAVAYHLIADAKFSSAEQQREPGVRKQMVRDFYVVNADSGGGVGAGGSGSGRCLPFAARGCPRSAAIVAEHGLQQESPSVWRCASRWRRRGAEEAAAQRGAGGAGGGGGGAGGEARAKWHLGLRSQSNPHDIMHERWLRNGFEWKAVNDFMVRVRKRDPSTGSYCKLTLQLFLVDKDRSYLLDFRQIVTAPEAATLAQAGVGLDDVDWLSRPEIPASSSTMQFFEMASAVITSLTR